jgi:hypothetical protein
MKGVLVLLIFCSVMISSKLASIAVALGASRQRKLMTRMNLLDDFPSKSHVKGLIDNAVNRAMSTLNTKEKMESKIWRDDQYSEKSMQNPRVPSFYENPCIHFTALAHLQWKYVLRPGVDAAIDATCGNGNDSCQIASILFPDGYAGKAELICIDIQQMACENTRHALEVQLGTPLMDPNVRVVCASHARLPTTSSPLALVCWNLGYLPRVEDKSTRTNMESTVTSIADAALQLRVGGLLSVIAYPKTNANEALATNALFEALAALTSNQTDWRDCLETLGPDPIPEEDSMLSVKEAVTKAMHRIIEEGDPNQTWRAMEHRMMGRILSPMLLTLTRIK